MSRGLLLLHPGPPGPHSLPQAWSRCCGVALTPESLVLEAPSVSLASWVPGPLSSQDILSEVIWSQLCPMAHPPTRLQRSGYRPGPARPQRPHHTDPAGVGVQAPSWACGLNSGALWLETGCKQPGLGSGISPDLCPVVPVMEGEEPRLPRPSTPQPWASGLAQKVCVEGQGPLCSSLDPWLSVTGYIQFAARGWRQGNHRSPDPTTEP